MKVRIFVSVFCVSILCFLSGFTSTSRTGVYEAPKLIPYLIVDAQNSSGQCVDYASVTVTWSGGSLSGTTGHIQSGCGAHTCQIGRIGWTSGLPPGGSAISITVTKGTYSNTLNTTMGGGVVLYTVNIGAAYGSTCCATGDCIPD